MRPPLVHIGFHKSGTTWLQRHLFARRELGFDRISLREKRIYAGNALDFDADAFRAHYQPRLERAAAEGLVPVISAERLSGNPHSGGYDSKEIATRLAAIFPGARILIVVREQRSMLLSTWSQYVKVGGPCSLRDYLFLEPDHRCPKFALEHLRYDRLVALYRELFGASNVLVELFERFRAEPRDFAAAILRFAGLPPASELPFEQIENRARGALALALRRRLNPLLRRDSVNAYSPLCNPLTSLGGRALVNLVDVLTPAPLDRALRRRWRRLIERGVEGFYARSNRRLAELCSLDLAGHGYEVERAIAPRALRPGDRSYSRVFTTMRSASRA